MFGGPARPLPDFVEWKNDLNAGMRDAEYEDEANGLASHNLHENKIVFY